MIEGHSESDWFEFAKWIGENLRLDGIELEGEGSDGDLFIQRPKIGINHQVINMHRQFLSRKYDALCLDGRPNHIIREQRQESLDDSNDTPWYMKPGRA